MLEQIVKVADWLAVKVQGLLFLEIVLIEEEAIYVSKAVALIFVRLLLGWLHHRQLLEHDCGAQHYLAVGAWRLRLLECLLRRLELPSHVLQDRLVIFEGAPLQLLLVHLHGLRISVPKVIYNL